MTIAADAVAVRRLNSQFRRSPPVLLQCSSAPVTLLLATTRRAAARSIVMKTILLREMDVHVAQVVAHDRQRPSSVYVFALRPRCCSRRRDDDVSGPVARRQDLDRVEWTADARHVPVIHEVGRTYSQCRTLSRDLQRLTDCKKDRACCCAQGSCPFWSLSLVLDGLPLPQRTTLFRRPRPSDAAHRTLALNAFIGSVLSVLRTNYRVDHFRNDDDDERRADVRPCKVLHRLCHFFELDQLHVAQRLLESTARRACQLNLRGWQSDRCNLYFQPETTGGGGGRDPTSHAPVASDLDEKQATTANASDDDDRRSA